MTFPCRFQVCSGGPLPQELHSLCQVVPSGGGVAGDDAEPNPCALKPHPSILKPLKDQLVATVARLPVPGPTAAPNFARAVADAAEAAARASAANAAAHGHDAPARGGSTNAVARRASLAGLLPFVRMPASSEPSNHVSPKHLSYAPNGDSSSTPVAACTAEPIDMTVQTASMPAAPIDLTHSARLRIGTSSLRGAAVPPTEMTSAPLTGHAVKEPCIGSSTGAMGPETDMIVVPMSSGGGQAPSSTGRSAGSFTMPTSFDADRKDHNPAAASGGVGGVNRSPAPSGANQLLSRSADDTAGAAAHMAPAHATASPPPGAAPVVPVKPYVMLHGPLLRELHPTFTPPDAIAPLAAASLGKSLLHFEVYDFAVRSAPHVEELALVRTTLEAVRSAPSLVSSTVACFSWSLLSCARRLRLCVLPPLPCPALLHVSRTRPNNHCFIRSICWI
jgi:hypothetical protein